MVRWLGDSAAERPPEDVPTSTDDLRSTWSANTLGFRDQSVGHTRNLIVGWIAMSPVSRRPWVPPDS
jgi:hypothetical protein